MKSEKKIETSCGRQKADLHIKLETKLSGCFLTKVQTFEHCMNTGFYYFSIVILFVRNINVQSNLDFFYNQSILNQAADNFMHYIKCIT